MNELRRRLDAGLMAEANALLAQWAPEKSVLHEAFRRGCPEVCGSMPYG